ncbi:heavy-metal-associated domain-containing protein [Streptomyces kunmingensis]|uniref:Heavy-metal-associated domain-containing protein n=1 Tax=Streptomyces kunmingensis TaxID=68225 RepID=A0ABU6CLU5_9ACTN|nr:heavy-metal-associated domain-containing protein [Streptomyces kunmingensis]MEB3965340.1 heavy-metal-associated domain-containing protein [Streptomyces kunmingensis]
MSAQTELHQIGTEAAASAPAEGSCCGGACHGDASAPAEGSVTTVYEVKGMTCGHCEDAVAGEISELAGVASVQAVAASGQVTVVSAAPLDEEAVRAAVDEAGYELVGTV